MKRSERARRYRCGPCDKGNCNQCIDVMRTFLGYEPRCPCDRVGHAGEPHGAPEHVCNDLCKIVQGES